MRGLTPPGEQDDLESGQFGHDSTHSDRVSLPPRRANFASTETNSCAGVRWSGSSSRCAGREPISSTKRPAAGLPAHVRGSRLGAISHQVEVFSAQPVSALLFSGLQSEGDTTIIRRAKARDHTERLLRHLGVVVDETETTVRMAPPDRLPAFNVTLPGDISTASLPIACVVASPSAPAARDRGRRHQ